MGTHDVVVVGAGPAGWAAALGLAQAGLDVAVVGPVGGGGRWNALLPRAERFLTRIGLDPQSPDVGGTPITGLVSVEGPRAVRFDALDADLPTMGVAVDGGALARTANAAWTGTRSAHPAVSVDGKAGAWRLTLDNGDTLNARFLVVADGQNGPIGHALAGRWVGPPLRQNAVAWVAHHTTPHGGWAFESSCDRGPVATTPLPDAADGGHRSAVVWVDHKDADTLTSPEAAAAGLEHVLGAHLGAITPPAQLHAWPVRFAQRRTWGPGWVALGEAARIWPPTGAQGLNHALMAAEELAACAASLERTATLLRWAARTESVGALRLGAVATLHGALSMPVGPLRGAALGLMERAPFLRRALMRTGLA